MVERADVEFVCEHIDGRGRGHFTAHLLACVSVLIDNWIQKNQKPPDAATYIIYLIFSVQLLENCNALLETK